MNFWSKRTFTGDEAPRSTWLPLTIAGCFKDTIFQFISLFLLLFIQYGTDLPLDPNFNTYFLVITIGLIVIKTVGTTFMFPLMVHLSNLIKLKSGNFRPYVFIGAASSMVFFLLMFFDTLSGWAFVVTFLIYYFFFEICFSINDFGYWGFFTSLTSIESVKAKYGAFSAIFIAIGTYALASIVPAISAGQAKLTLRIIVAVIAALFVLSSLILCFITKERPIEFNYKSHFTDTFKILKQNKYSRASLIMLALFFTAQFIVMGTSVNLFYYTYGYGNQPIYGSLLASGGFTGVCFIFTIVYGLASSFSQFMYPLINKKLPRKKILTISTMGVITCYLLIYFIFSNRGMIYYFFIIEFIMILFQGQINAIVLLSSNILPEINEYLTNERRDKEFMALKNVFVKYSGAFQTGFFYMFLSFSGLSDLNQKIGDYEAQGVVNTGFDVVNAVNTAIMNTISSSDYDSHLMIYKILTYILPAILFLIIWIIYMKFYNIDEAKFKEINLEVKNRKLNTNKNKSITNN
ncbi:MAG: MFS transporter [Bacilli bacterium]